MRKSFIFVLVLFCSLLGNAFAEPCAFVNDAADIRFIELKELAKFLEKDLDLGKGVTKFIGNKVIDRKFRKAGIPDPAKEGLEYCIVAKEMGVNELNLSFILKGSVNTENFIKFTDKRMKKYLTSLEKQGISFKRKAIYNTKISGKASRIYPFAFRNSEAVVTSFNDYTIISTVPTKNYSQIKEIISVLTGKKPLSSRQANSSYYMASFIPTEQERHEIKNFKNPKNTFASRVRKGFQKIRDQKSYNRKKHMETIEIKLKNTLSQIKGFSYQIETKKEKSGYAYNVNMLFKCNHAQQATYLKELMLAWLTYGASKTKTDNDMVSFRSNKVLSTNDTCVFSVELGSSKAEQYQFSSLIMTLMMQDRRFDAIFKK